MGEWSMLRHVYDPLFVISGSIVRPLVYAAMSIAIIAYIYTWYKLDRITDIPLAQLTVHQLVNNAGFFLAMFFGIILGGGIIHAGLSNDVNHDRRYLLVLLTLVFLFYGSEKYMTLAGCALRAIGIVVACLQRGLFAFLDS
jgi:hypothetical protein